MKTHNINLWIFPRYKTTFTGMFIHLYYCFSLQCLLLSCFHRLLYQFLGFGYWNLLFEWGNTGY